MKDSRILYPSHHSQRHIPHPGLVSLEIGNVVLSFAMLSFLGIGTEIGYADWGQVLSFARNWITSLNQYWYIIVCRVLRWCLRDGLEPGR